MGSDEGSDGPGGADVVACRGDVPGGGEAPPIVGTGATVTGQVFRESALMLEDQGASLTVTITDPAGVLPRDATVSITSVAEPTPSAPFALGPVFSLELHGIAEGTAFFARVAGTADPDRIGDCDGRAEQPDARARVDLQSLIEAECAEQPGVIVEGHAAVVRGSRGQLRTVVANLLANARQHGGAAARIVVRAFGSERETGFEVIDDGPGIPSAHLPRVFDRFFTTDRREGLGLGLALVRSICRAHGGDVSVASRPGHTVLRVVLPPGG